MATAKPSAPAANDGRRSIQSIEVGVPLLAALVDAAKPLTLRDLAAGAGMTSAKAHPYLVSFGKLGLIEQDAVSGHYGLCPLAMQLGLISLQQVDPVRLAIAELPALAQRIGYTVSASVWGDNGPTIIRVEEGPTAVYVAMRHGTTASVRHTATGKVFAVFGPRERAAAALAAEGFAGALDEPAFAAELEAVRQHQISEVTDQLLPGISALATPVFDGFGQLVLCLAVIGPSATLQTGPGSAVAGHLRDTARSLSQRLGAAQGTKP